ncbi:hypothetical protein GCM10028807_58080 [Spirosoma daeguense]
MSPFETLLGKALDLHEEYDNNPDPNTGFKLGHHDNPQIVFYSVPLDRMDEFLSELDSVNVPYTYRTEAVDDEVQRVIVTVQ